MGEEVDRCVARNAHDAAESRTPAGPFRRGLVPTAGTRCSTPPMNPHPSEEEKGLGRIDESEAAGGMVASLRAR